jgi:hypothetical protein
MMGTSVKVKSVQMGSIQSNQLSQEISGSVFVFPSSMFTIAPFDVLGQAGDTMVAGPELQGNLPV